MLRKLAQCAFLFAALPMSHSATQGDTSPSSVILGERVSALEEFRRQQRDWNYETDHRLSGEISDVTRRQGTRDERVSGLQGRLDTLYRLGGVGGFLVTVLSPIAWATYSKRHRKMMKLWSKLVTMAELQGYSLTDLEMEED